ncbi:hypothetical protein HK096_002222, partial [Nowakowskiella sp. JEL0078]
MGELCLDAYPFLKARAVAKGRYWLNLLCFAGFIPLVVAKVCMIIFRYYYCFAAKDGAGYFSAQAEADAIVLGLSAWSDLLNSIVIVYAGTESRRIVKNDFLSNLVRTTELRIVVCTMLTIMVVVLTAIDPCPQDPSVNGSCTFKGVRDVAVSTVYSLYLMDYLVIKFHRVFQSEKTIRGNLTRKIDPVEPKTKAVWPVFGLARQGSLTMGHSTTHQSAGTGTELDTPSFQILKRTIQQYGGGGGGSSVLQKSQQANSVDSVISEDETSTPPFRVGIQHPLSLQSSDDDSAIAGSSSHINGYQPVRDNGENVWYQNPQQQQQAMFSNPQARETKIFRPIQ